jgi:hypothetical protein
MQGIFAGDDCPWTVALGFPVGLASPLGWAFPLVSPRAFPSGFPPGNVPGLEDCNPALRLFPKQLFDSNYAFANDRPFQRTRPERSRVGDLLEQADNKG